MGGDTQSSPLPSTSAGWRSPGPSVLIVENVSGSPKDGVIYFSIAEDGTLVYIPRPSLEGRTLVWVDRNGKEEGLGLSPRAFSTPRLSAEGTELAVAIENADGQDVWVYDLARRTEHRVTFENFNEAPVFTPDGTRLTFASGPGTTRNLFSKPADGTGIAERLTESDLRQWPYDWSPDGKALVFMETDPSDYWSLGILRPEGGPRTEPFAKASGTQNKPRFSPDGRWNRIQLESGTLHSAFPGTRRSPTSVERRRRGGAALGPERPRNFLYAALGSDSNHHGGVHRNRAHREERQTGEALRRAIRRILIWFELRHRTRWPAPR